MNICFAKCYDSTGMNENFRFLKCEIGYDLKKHVIQVPDFALS